MTVEQRYYQLAGYWSVPCMCVPLLALFALRVWSNGLFLAFGTVGLLCAISGFLRGGLKARLCAVTALIVFGALAFVFLCESRWF